MAVVIDNFELGQSHLLEVSEMDDATLARWLSVPEALEEYIRRRHLADERSLPPGVFDARHLPGQHDQKTHGHGGGAADKAPLTNRQYEALRPQPYSRDLELGTELELEETEAGKDLVGAIRRHTDSFSGCAELSDDVWKVAQGGSTGDVQRDRQARALIDSVRHAPDMVPTGKLLSGKVIPGKLHRGIAVDDIEGFAAKHKTGSIVELSSTSWSRDKSQTTQYSHTELDGWHPVTITLDTSNGVKALPVQNLMHYPENHALQEFITMGQFEVASFGESSAKRGDYELRLKQTGVF